MDMSDMETPGPSRRKRKGGQDDGPPRKRASLSHDEEDRLDSEISDLSQVSPDAGLRNTLKPPKAGIIESVELRDFMCHKHLKVPFGRNMTIINGKNGSGKSAVLVALAVGLGGKAAATKRGSSLKNFIREGCGSALVQINIHNQGSSETGAFQQEKYDDMIVVERRINSDGTGGYKLKNGKTRKVISSAKEDLQKMLDHFNILVDNPACILHQDMSRNFLYSTSSKDKYQLFMDATQLSSEYSKMKTRHAEIKCAVTDRKASLKQLEKVAADHKRLYKDLVQVDELEEKKEILKSDIAWAQVFAIEQQIKPLQEAVKAKEKQLLEYEDKVSECKAAQEQARIKHKGLNEQLQELTQEAQNRKAEEKEVQAVLQRKITRLREADKKLKATKQKMHHDQELSNCLEASKSNLESALEVEELHDVTALQEAVHHFDMVLQQLSEQLMAEEKYSQIQTLVAHLQKDVHENHKDVEKLLEHGESLKNELDVSIRNVCKCEEEYKHYSSGLAKKRQELEDARSALANKERKFESCQKRVAEVYPERSETTDSVQNLESKLKSLNKRIEEREKIKGQREEIRKAYHDSIQRYQKLKKEIKHLDSFKMRLGHKIAMRLDLLKNSRQWLQTRLKIHFLMTMSKCGYKGDVCFDDKNETLEVVVSKEAKLTKDSKALSAGEQSFSIVAFMLSLWGATNIPFHCLDAFDVSMDLVVRRIAMAELITAAKLWRNRQMILLTPQDLSGFDEDPDVHILRLHDPERNQATLDFSATRSSSSCNS